MKEIFKTAPIGLSNNKTIANTGAINAFFKGNNSFVCSSTRSVSLTIDPLLLMIFARTTAVIKPNTAGIKPAIITSLRGKSKPFAAAIVFGLGEIILPALPPPDKAINNDNLLIPVLFPTDRAIGATINTATGMNTPTAVITIVDNAKDKIAFFSPSFCTMALAIDSAAPDSIITPANMPAAKTRIAVPIILCVPFNRTATVSDREAPPIRQPTIAPKNKEYTGLNFFKINTIATTNPKIAATQDIVISGIQNQLLKLFTLSFYQSPFFLKL